MRRTSLRTLVLTTAGVTFVVATLLAALAAQRVFLAPIPPVEWLALLALTVTTLVLGWAVRAFLRGKKPNLDPIRAARTLALAKAASLTGAVLLGRYLAIVLLSIMDWQISAQRERTIAAGIAAICALALIAAGVIVERWCQLPPPADKAEAPAPNTSHQAMA